MTQSYHEHKENTSLQAIVLPQLSQKNFHRIDRNQCDGKKESSNEALLK
jgi:hypothetical protein